MITGVVWHELLERFAPVSESYLRELLRDSGVPIEQPWGGVRQHTLAELEESLGELVDLYEGAVAAGDKDLARYCRKVVIGAKDRAKFALAKGNESKREMVDWMMVWLENVGVWREWVGVRKTKMAFDAEARRRGEFGGGKMRERSQFPVSEFDCWGLGGSLESVLLRQAIEGGSEAG